MDVPKLNMNISSPVLFGCAPVSGKKKKYISSAGVNAFFLLIALTVFSLWKSSVVVAAMPAFKVNGHVLTITTDRYEVDWENGSMVRIVTLLPKHQVLASPPKTIKKGNLPVGLGSFFRNQAAARAQHGPLSGRPIPCSFDAQHPADQSSTLTWESIPDGIRLKYQGLKGDPGAVLVQELTVEAGTGDLVIRQHGAGSNPGVFGISFSVENLKSDLSTVIPFLFRGAVGHY
jgi:hypothetical protein